MLPAADPDDQTNTCSGGDEARVEAWRLSRLLDAGYPVDIAERLAAAPVDLHRAVELAAAAGPGLAARILL